MHMPVVCDLWLQLFSDDCVIMPVVNDLWLLLSSTCWRHRCQACGFLPLAIHVYSLHKHLFSLRLGYFVFEEFSVVVQKV